MTIAKDTLSSSNHSKYGSNFTITLNRILELLDLEEDDEYGILKPTEYAFLTVMKLTIQAYDIMGNEFPRGSASTDEKGGIRLTWRKIEADCEVGLFCPAKADQPSDIYHHRNAEYGVDDVISVSTLVNWLQWFNIY